MTRTSAWRILQIALLVLVLGVSVGCATRTNSVLRGDLTELTDVSLYLVNSSGIQSLQNTQIETLDATQMMDGEAQTVQALQMMEFELLGLGFSTVQSDDAADAIAEFSIGQVRYDAVAGWIADRALLRFRKQDGSTIAVFQAEARFITPTVDALIDSIANEVASARR